MVRSELTIDASLGRWFDSDYRSKEKSLIVSMLKTFVEGFTLSAEPFESKSYFP
jgi:hypothetical protein